MKTPGIEEAVTWYRSVSKTNPDLAILYGQSTSKQAAWLYPVAKGENPDLEEIVQALEEMLQLLAPGKFQLRARPNKTSSNGELYFKFEKPGAATPSRQPGIAGMPQGFAPVGYVSEADMEKRIAAALEKQTLETRLEALEDALENHQAPSDKDKMMSAFMQAITGNLTSMAAPAAQRVAGIPEAEEVKEEPQVEYNDRIYNALDVIIEKIPDQAPELFEKFANLDTTVLAKLSQVSEAKINQALPFL